MSSLRLRYAAGSGAGLAAKLLGVLFFAWRFPAEAYASLVEVQAQTSLWVLVAGFDLYVFFGRRWVHREATIPKDELMRFVTSIAVSYLVIGPMVVLLSRMNWVHTAALLGVIATEHASQEVNRLLLAFERHLQAMTVQLLRNLAWVVLFVLLAQATALKDPLTIFLAFWAGGGLAGVAVGAYFLRSHLAPASGVRTRQLAVEALGVVVPSIGSTLAQRSMLTADRLFVAAVLPLLSVSAYGMYVTIAAGALAVADISVGAFAGPRFMHLLKPTSGVEATASARRLMRRSVVQIAVVHAAVGSVGWLFIVACLDASFAASPLAFALVQCAYAFLAMSHVGDSVLYGAGRFRTQLLGNVACALFFGVGLAIVSMLSGGLASVAFSVAVAFGLLLVWKLHTASRFLSEHRPPLIGPQCESAAVHAGVSEKANE
jgi:hypothetical protein